jgi:glycerol kinase
VQRTQIGSESRFSFAAGRLEKFLKTAVNQNADLAAHDYTGGLDHTHCSIRQLQNRRAAVAADSNTARSRQHFRRESGVPDLLEALFVRRFFQAGTAKKHISIIIAPMPFILSLDEGTTSARSVLYDEEGRRVAMESVAFASRYPQPGWVEQDALEIWRAQMESARKVLERSRVAASDIVAAGITNQRETTVVWDRRTGEPVAPAIVWQCRRTAEYCTRLAATPEAAEITRKTGLVIDAYFSASKIRWILENVPHARKRAEDGELLFGNIDTWLIWKLTGGAVHATDPSNASRTMLMNLATGDWDDGLLRIFDVPRAMLPRIVPSSGVAGEISPEHLGASIPIAGIAGDQQAALAGQACFRPGLSKNTYGTGCFALLHTGTRAPVSKNRLLATRAASTNAQPQFAIEGSVFIAGAAIQWVRDELKAIATAAESEAVAASVSDNGGVYFVPAFVGLGAPHWDPNARGLITGLTRSTGRAHIVRAAIESITYQTRELVEAMQADAGEELRELRVDGGAAVNDVLMQFQSDILGKPIVRPVDVETTALGAAYLAGLATGFWKSVGEVESFWRAERRFEPKMPAEIRERFFGEWKAAVARARG